MGETGEGSPVSIAAVERDTGLSKDTLRVWERRYGFPRPVRGPLAERSYPPDQVRKLFLLKRLLDSGHRPGRVVALPMEALQHLADQAERSPARSAVGPGAAWDAWIGALHDHDAQSLRRMLGQQLLQLGLQRFVTELVAPLNDVVGRAWMAGSLRVFEEHLYTECVQTVLRNAISSVGRAGPPRVLLATLPQESHGLGLLMVEALLCLEGCQCLSLGVQVPMAEIVAAARAHRADIVGLSFSASFNAVQAVDGLAELRAGLDAATELWAGGKCSAVQRRSLEGVRTVGEVGAVGAEVARWRSTAGSR